MEFLVFIIIGSIIFNKNKEKISEFINKHTTIEAKENSGSDFSSGKLRSQTNNLSRRVEIEQATMQYLDESHDDYHCKYTTQDPNFSFNGKPNNFDDFAELRRKNEEHERHLQKRIY